MTPEFLSDKKLNDASVRVGATNPYVASVPGALDAIIQRNSYFALVDGLFVGGRRQKSQRFLIGISCSLDVANEFHDLCVVSHYSKSHGTPVP